MRLPLSILAAISALIAGASAQVASAHVASAHEAISPLIAHPDQDWAGSQIAKHEGHHDGSPLSALIGLAITWAMIRAMWAVATG